MRLAEIGRRLAIELRSADLVAAGLLSAYYPAPSKVNTDGAIALVFTRLGAAPAWSEQSWQHEYLVRLMVPARGFQAAEINALEPLIEPIWDHFPFAGVAVAHHRRSGRSRPLLSGPL